MKILFIAPLPPPITGHSLVSGVLRDHLARTHEVEVVDLSKESFTEGVDGLDRIRKVGGMIVAAWRRHRSADAIYLTISESLAGNVKDLFLYAACLCALPRMVIHLHGGSIKRDLWDHHPLLRRVNALFLRRLGGVVISGESHREIFQGLVARDRLHIVPNFAQDHLILDEAGIRAKFARATPLRVLYMSSMKRKKGYADLLTGYLLLSEEERALVQLDFAGRFGSPHEEAQFREQVAPLGQVHYHGVVDDSAKTALFGAAHVFALPSAYFEGQPISILEAYASGCAVLATGQSGIRDVFRDGVNGHEIAVASPASIRDALASLVANPGALLPVALENRQQAGARYRSATYLAAVGGILTSSRVFPT